MILKKKNTISRYSCQNVNESRSKDLILFMYKIVQEKGNLGIIIFSSMPLCPFNSCN